MSIIGIDLSGPCNPNETAAVCFREKGSTLIYDKGLLCADDEVLCEFVGDLASGANVAVGVDAPLSYNVGGGDRDRDKELRRRLVDKGLPPGSVMAPTMTRMSYLTLRGIGLTRALERIRVAPWGIRIVETHPVGCLVLRGAPVALVKRLKQDHNARSKLVAFLEAQGLEGACRVANKSHHMIAACACCLAAWNWVRGSAIYIATAHPPHHPYELVC